MSARYRGPDESRRLRGAWRTRAFFSVWSVSPSRGRPAVTRGSRREGGWCGRVHQVGRPGDRSVASIALARALICSARPHCSRPGRYFSVVNVSRTAALNYWQQGSPESRQRCPVGEQGCPAGSACWQPAGQPCFGAGGSHLLLDRATQTQPCRLTYLHFEIAASQECKAMVLTCAS